MAGITIPTNFNIDVEFEKAEFHRRLFAWILDVVVQVLYILVVSKIISLAGGVGAENSYWAGLIIIFPLILYHILMEIFMNGQSVGKRILKIQVINETGGKASISQYVIRGLIRTSDYMLLIIILVTAFNPLMLYFLKSAIGLSVLLTLADIILVSTSRKGQRLGDFIAHTIVISTKTRGSIHDTIFLEVEDSYVPRFPEIMKLSDKDINAIKNILDNANQKGDFQLAAMAMEKIKNHLGIQSNLSPFDFLATALKDYNYLSGK